MTILELKSALSAARAKIYIPHEVRPFAPDELAVHTDGRYVYIEGETAAQLALETPPLETNPPGDGRVSYFAPRVQVTTAGVRLYEFVESLPAILDALRLSETLSDALQKALDDERDAHARTRTALEAAERAAREAYPFPPNTRVYRDFPGLGR